MKEEICEVKYVGRTGDKFTAGKRYAIADRSLRDGLWYVTDDNGASAAINIDDGRWESLDCDGEPVKIGDAKETPQKQYQVMLGVFINNAFVWHKVGDYDDLRAAYKAYKAYVNSQLKYTDEELKKVWDTGRLDVELRRGNKLLNWVGIYAREVDKLSAEAEKKADKDKPENKKDKTGK